MSHITNREKQELLKLLENGYKEMSQINLDLAEEGVPADNEALSAALEKLKD